MRKDLAVEIIRDFHDRSPPELVDRDLRVRLPRSRKAITVIGPRRAGKTFFFYNNMLRLEGVDRTRMVYLNLEDDRLLPLDVGDLDAFLRTYYEVCPESKDTRVHLFLDEVQNVEGWESFVRRVLDTEDVQVWLTGSSSKMLASEVATSMRGRSATYTILPFSFGEFLRARGISAQEHLSSRERSWVMKSLLEYVTFGGFPEVVLEDDVDSRLRTLKEYVEVMLMRDVVERHKVKNIRVLRLLLASLIRSFSSEFSAHKFYGFLKSQNVRVSKKTIYSYQQSIEDALFVLPVRRYSPSLRELEQSLPKVYPVDNGIMYQFGLRPDSRMGGFMENTVANELFRRRAREPGLELYYWKDPSGKEVDFVLRQGDECTELIQVSYDIGDPDTRRREITPLVKAGEEMGCSVLKIITWDGEETIEDRGIPISVVPLWKWLSGIDQTS